MVTSETGAKQWDQREEEEVTVLVRVKMWDIRAGHKEGISDQNMESNYYKQRGGGGSPGGGHAKTGARRKEKKRTFEAGGSTVWLQGGALRDVRRCTCKGRSGGALPLRRSRPCFPSKADSIWLGV